MEFFIKNNRYFYKKILMALYLFLKLQKNIYNNTNLYSAKIFEQVIYNGVNILNLKKEK